MQSAAQAVETSLQGARVAISGAHGYLASRLIVRLQRHACEIFPLQTRKEAPIEMPRSLGLIHAPQPLASLAHLKIDVLFHLAAQTDAKKAEDDILQNHHDNVEPLIRILEICRMHQLPMAIIQTGSATQCGLTHTTPSDEQSLNRPITAYYLHKGMCEVYLEYYQRVHQIKGTSLRLTNVYGPGQPSSQSARGVLNLMIKKAIAGEDLTIYGDGDFLRDYLYVDDAVDALVTAYARLENTNGRVFLIGSGVGQPIKTAFNRVAHEVSNILKNKVIVKSIPAPTPMHPIEERQFVADISAFKDATGWKPSHELEEGIQKTVQYFIKQS